MLSPYTFLCPPLYLALLYHANRPERYSRQHLEQKRQSSFGFATQSLLAGESQCTLAGGIPVPLHISHGDTRWRGICAYIPSIKPVSAKMQLSGLVVVLLLLGSAACFAR